MCILTGTHSIQMKMNVKLTMEDVNIIVPTGLEVLSAVAMKDINLMEICSVALVWANIVYEPINVRIHLLLQILMNALKCLTIVTMKWSLSAQTSLEVSAVLVE